MKNTRTISSYQARGKTFKVGALLWGDFLLLQEDPQAGYLKIISEFNEEIPVLNKRQMEALFQSLTSNKSLKGEKKTRHFDKEQFLVIEGLLMHQLHQERSSIREWTLEYVMGILELLPVIIGQKGYDEVKNREKPDKKALNALKKTLKNKSD